MTPVALHRFGKICAAAACAVLFSICTAHATDMSQRTGIAATVNDDAITFSDIRNRLQLYLAGNPQTPPPEVRHKLELQVLDKLIDERLQMQEAKKEGINVTEEDLNHGIQQVAAQNHMSVEQFKDKLASAGVKMSSMDDQLRAEIAWSQLVRRKLRPDVNVSESEIDNAMAQISKTKGATEYLVAEILLPVTAKELDDAVRHEADDIIASLQHGGSFQQAARQYSKAPGAAQGGDLGWIREGVLGDKLDAALRTMHPGQLSAPIRTDKGYDILFLRDIHDPNSASAQPAAPRQAAAPAPATPAPAAPAAPSKPQVIVHLKQITIPIASTDPAPVVAAKMNRAQTLKSEITSCAQMDKKSKDFVSPGTTDMGNGPLNALPEAARRAVENLPIGTLSEPVRGDNGVAVLMVCDKTVVPGRPEAAAAAPAAPAPAPAPAVAQGPGPGPAMTDDEKSRDQVANQIGMKRLDQMQEHYLRDLRATAFIEKRI